MTAKNQGDRATGPEPRLKDRAEAAELCQQLLVTIDRLGEVMASETELLKASKAQEIGPLQDEKTDLVQTYLKLFTEFKASTALIGARAPCEVDRLRQAHTAFEDIVSANMVALAATRAAAHSVVGAIFEFASARNAGPLVYGDNAGMAPAQANRPTAIALDLAL